MLQISYLEKETKITVYANDTSANALFSKLSHEGIPCYVLNDGKMVQSANLDVMKVSKNVVEAKAMEEEHETAIKTLTHDASIKIAEWLINLAKSMHKSFSLHKDSGLKPYISICVWYEDVYKTITEEDKGPWTIFVNYGRKKQYYPNEPEKNQDFSFGYEFIKNWPEFKESILDCLNHEAETCKAKIEEQLKTLENFDA